MFKKSILSILIGLTLAACGGVEGENENNGGGDNSGNPGGGDNGGDTDNKPPIVTPPVGYKGRILGSTDTEFATRGITSGTDKYGYMSGVRVCYDISGDGKCGTYDDPTDLDGSDGIDQLVEPNDLTDENGFYVLPDYNKTTVFGPSLVAEVLENDSIVFTLMAPFDYEYISTLTTLVDYELRMGANSVEEAEKAVHISTGMEFEINKDFIAEDIDNKEKVVKLSNTLIGMFEEFTTAAYDSSVSIMAARSSATYSDVEYDPIEVVEGVYDSVPAVSDEIVENPEATYEEIMAEAGVNPDDKMQEIEEQTGVSLLDSVAIGWELMDDTHYELEAKVNESSQSYEFMHYSYNIYLENDSDGDGKSALTENRSGKRFSDNLVYQAPYVNGDSRTPGWTSSASQNKPTKTDKYLDSTGNWITLPDAYTSINVDETALHMYVNGSPDHIAFKTILGSSSINGKTFDSVLNENELASTWSDTVNGTFDSSARLYKKNNIAFKEMYELSENAKFADGSDWTDINDNSAEIPLFKKLKADGTVSGVYTGQINGDESLDVYYNGSLVEENIINSAGNKFPTKTLEYVFPISLQKHLQNDKDGAAGVIFATVGGNVEKGHLLASGALVGDEVYLFNSSAIIQLEQSVHNNYCGKYWTDQDDPAIPSYCEEPEPDNGGGGNN